MLTESQLSPMLDELRALPKETEWVEFKVNNEKPEEIGKYISALANAAALHEKPNGFMVWGIEDGTHAPVGTSFTPSTAKVGNEALENWLARLLEPRIDFRFHAFTYQDVPVVLLEIQPATFHPVRFKQEAFIRVGSYKKPLREHPEKERQLWLLSSRVPFEKGVAMANVSSDIVLGALDYPAVFELLGRPLPDNRDGILSRLEQERFITKRPGGLYDVTNLGAILFAKDLSQFDRLGRKALRVIFYKGNSRVETIREQTGVKGYAVGYEGAVAYINDRLPANEVIGQALRREERMYPDIAIRELVANVLIHQDFNIFGAGPMVEIFSDRMEFSNPGKPLIDTLRFIDHTPRSRNEDLAAFMRCINICEERGSGIDKVITAVELHQLPPPDFREVGDNTVVVLFAHRKFSAMDADDRIRACYQHACLCHESNTQLTNQSLRVRFGIEDRNKAMVTRVIKAALDRGVIKPFDKDQSKKFAKYVPFWT
ncbi:ATP-binding protein [Megalodesulfovibrio gigas]|uniref:Putative ATPase, AAA_4 family n=1 Tax=Megalodesulfovibrio gigas (strain ATCC 19364 / DSM 1382 / NCIMB 9332 / VKM B-1759) TaxID=1121448 RepID=T2GB81_MEGG1|nr:ATP-binding protein [Megalodesulfovibrio gigas]AGW13152.1 putative ATPase, AAA_4 family [Megalodesulfovibrio gigas DSM 1382 = ATCC 19364]